MSILSQNIAQFLKSGIFWTIFVGFIGIFAGFYISKFFQSKVKLVYDLTDEKIILFDTNNVDRRTKLVIDDSVIVTENVNITKIKFWNAGNTPIDSNFLRSPIKIILLEGQILTSQVVSEVPMGLPNVRLIPRGKSETLVKWNYLDPNFGFTVQVLHTSKRQDGLLVKGFLLGGSPIKNSSYKPTFKNLFTSILLAFVGPLLFIGAILQIVGWKNYIQYSRSEKSYYIFGIIFGLLGGTFLSALGLGGLYELLFRVYLPPF